MTDLYVDADACPVREEVYRVAERLGLKVFVVSNGSRPIRPSPNPNIIMITVGAKLDEADDWIAEHITAKDVCVTSDIPLAVALPRQRGPRPLVQWQAMDAQQYRLGAGGA